MSEQSILKLSAILFMREPQNRVHGMRIKGTTENLPQKNGSTLRNIPRTRQGQENKESNEEILKDPPIRPGKA